MHTLNRRNILMILSVILGSYMLPAVKSYGQTTVINCGVVLHASKYSICPGETVDIAGGYAADLNTSTILSLLIQNINYVFNECDPGRCVRTGDVEPTVTGGEAIKNYFRGDPCNSPYGGDSLRLTVSPTVTTTYTIEWEGRRTIEANNTPGCEADQIVNIYHYTGTITIEVSDRSTPSLSRTRQTINQDDFTKTITASGVFNTPVRQFIFYKNYCGVQQEISAPYLDPAANAAELYVNTGQLGTHEYRVRKNDNGCISAFGSPAIVKIKPCNITPPGGCKDDVVNYVESHSCNEESTVKEDYHFYDHETVVGDTEASLDAYWEAYKSDMSNQVIVQSDQFGDALTGDTSFISTLFNKVLFPSDAYAGRPVTDNCETLQLPRPYSWAVTLGRFSPNRWVSTLSTIIASSGPGMVSNFDPVFLRVSEDRKCITNYTLPGHIFYPGKVTRCLVQECGETKILTFGEGTTSFSGDFAVFLRHMNETWGASMFRNVDYRAAQKLANVHRPAGIEAIPHSATGIVSTNENLLYKRFRVKDLRIKYADNDTVYTIYQQGDTINFWKMSNLEFAFLDDGTYKAISVIGTNVTGLWKYDSITNKLTVDTGTASITMNSNEFSLTGSLSVFDSTTLSTATYYMTLEQFLKSNIWTGTVSSAWENPANWSNGVVPDETMDVIINETPAHEPLISLPAKCKSLKIQNGRIIDLHNELQVMGKNN